MTALTDAILALITVALAGRLFARAAGRRPVLLWAWAFVFMALAAISGALYHYGVRAVWKAVPLSSGAAMFCFGCAAAAAWLRPPLRRAAIVLLALQFAGCIAMTVKSDAFWVAIADAAPVLLALLLGAAMRRGDASSPSIIAGVVLTIVGAGVQAISALHLGPFNHNDLFHLIQMPAMFLLYRGGRAL